MLSSELAKKTGMNQSTIRKIVRKLYPDFFVQSKATHISKDMLPSIMAEITEFKSRQGVSKAELSRRFDVTLYTANVTAKAMGIHGKYSKIPLNRVEEFKEMALKRTDRRSATEKTTKIVNEVYARMMKDGYILGSDLKKVFGHGNYVYIVAHFDSRDMSIYDCEITLYSKEHIRGIDVYELHHVKAFRPFEIINRIWREERQKQSNILKNGFIKTNDRSVIGASVIA